MSHHLRLAAALTPLCLSLAGCVGLGTNVKGQFTCRAPSGTCAPSRTIDERATKEIASPDPDSGFSAARQRAGIAAPVGSDDPARTAERRLRVVFPAHVDETGTLHDEAVAWTVIEAPHWAAELGASSTPSTAPLARQIGRQLKAAQAEDERLRLAGIDAVVMAARYARKAARWRALALGLGALAAVEAAAAVALAWRP